MGSTQNCVFRQRNRNPIVFIFVMLVLSSTHLRFMAEGGRPISGKQLTEEAGAVVNARQIGSRPPRCERRCGGCGNCVAVQIPIAPQGQSQRKMRRSQSSMTSTPKNVAYSRGDDITNYKPMSWKCKCGNLFFNP